MKYAFFLTILLIIQLGCSNKESPMLICFDKIRERINNDSVIQQMKNAPIDSCGYYLGIINNAVEAESVSDSLCSKAINEQIMLNQKYSMTVINVILFQEFQSYLRHERFDRSQAERIALELEAKWKRS